MHQIFLVDPVKVGWIQGHSEFTQRLWDQVFDPLVPVYHKTGLVLQKEISNLFGFEEDVFVGASDNNTPVQTGRICAHQYAGLNAD